MNDENQENEALKGPVILTIPASLTVPGFGFLVALNPDWCFTSQGGRQVHHRASHRGSSVGPGERPPLTKGIARKAPISA